MSRWPRRMRTVSVPDPESGLETLLEFAHSYNGYARHAATPERLGQLVLPLRHAWEQRNVLPATDLATTRAALFYLARELHHGGEDENDDEYARALTARIADLVPPGPRQRRTVLDLSHGAYQGPHAKTLPLVSDAAGRLGELVRAAVDHLLRYENADLWAWRAANGPLAPALTDNIGWLLTKALTSNGTYVRREGTTLTLGNIDIIIVDIDLRRPVDGPQFEALTAQANLTAAHDGAQQRGRIAVLAGSQVTHPGTDARLHNLALKDPDVAVDLQLVLGQRADVSLRESALGSALGGRLNALIYTVTGRTG